MDLQQKLIVNVWDWIVTKTGEVRQITSDDMMDLKHEDIERHAKIEELPVEVAKKRIREIADKVAGVEKERETLSEFESLPTEFPTYSQYTVLKAMKQHSDKKAKDFAEWVDKNLNGKQYRDWMDGIVTTSELLEIFNNTNP